MTVARPLAAHFIPSLDMADSPENDQYVGALLELGFGVTVFAPSGTFARAWGSHVDTADAKYGFRWIAENALSPRWRRFALVSASTEDPVGPAGVIATVHRRPLVVLATEICSGSYRGDRTERWKSLCRRSMRRARLTVVNDASRVALQRDYAGLDRSREILVVPNSFRAAPPPAVRAEVRARLGIPADAFVLGFSGVVHEGLGVSWALEALDAMPDLHLHVKTRTVSSTLKLLFARDRHADRIHLDDRNIPAREAWAEAVALDVGMAVYLQDAPQFQNMGTSSNRLCMFLAMGIPVIVSRQPSFDFLDRSGAGVQVANSAEFVRAIDFVRSRRDSMSDAALRCATEHVRAAESNVALVGALRRITGSRQASGS
jgi:glycosyltransferase involved in cell wall biosynthesis